MSPAPTEFTIKLAPEVAGRLLNSSTDAIIVVDASGTIALANERATALFGYDADEMLGQKVEMLLPDGMRQSHGRWREDYRGKPHARPLLSGLNLQGKTKDGRIFDANIALTPIETDSGLLVASTISESGEKSSSESYFRMLLESAPDAMIIADNQGRIAVVNKQAERMFGYERKELLGGSIEKLLPARLQREHERHRREYLDDPRTRPMGLGMELAGQRRDGSEFPVEISLSPVRHSGGLFVSSVIRDVTERKILEQNMIDARVIAERANKAQTAFLTAASHDLRQPVQALELLNGALRRSAQDPFVHEIVESQQHALEAMTNLLNSLLDIGRLDAGAIEPEIEEFPMQRLIDRLSAEFSRQATHKGLAFQADSCRLVVRSDPNLLDEIIQNLVSNAIRYTGQGEVRLTCREQAGQLSIDVSDTGIGIEADQLKDIFREFHQIHNSKAGKGGFGLGLAIVQRLADLLGHRIVVESQPGHGSRFSVLVPLAPDNSGIGDTDKQSQSARPSHSEAAGSIVLIEDDVLVAQAWRRLLEREGYDVSIAATVQEARDVVDRLMGVPDLIISDFHLADGSSGIVAIRNLRAAFQSDIPAFVVTGDTSKIADEARALKNSTLMRKPVNTDILLDMVHRAVVSGQIENG